MDGKRMRNRYVILGIAACVNFVHGNPYIWTVFQPYVREEFGVSVAASSQPFTLIIGIFAVGNMIGGYLQHRLGAKRTILLGSYVMCAGFLLAAMAPYEMPWLISAGYGVIGGLGSGCAFSLLVAVPQAWFPERKGLVTGITIGVVGISGVVMNPLCDYILAARGYRFAMLTVTGIYAVLCLGAVFIAEAPEKPCEAGKQRKASLGGCEQDEALEAALRQEKEILAGDRQYTTREMMRTKNFYLICAIMALAVPAYVLVNPLMKSLGMERGLTGSQALAGVVAASFANIIGRFAMPWLSDRTGCRAVIQVMYGAAMVSVLGLTAARGGWFVIFISVVCLVYGGVVSVFPVLVSNYFGMKYQGMNYGAVMLGYGVVSILCPYLLEAAGQQLSFVIAGAACGIGMLGMRFLKK